MTERCEIPHCHSYGHCISDPDRHPYIVLFKGDSSNFAGNQEIVVRIDTEISLVGYKAFFRLLDFQQIVDPIPEDKKFSVVFNSDVTSGFPLGFCNASLVLMDMNGLLRTIANRIPVVVTNSISEAYYNTDKKAITVTVKGGGFVKTVNGMKPDDSGNVEIDIGGAVLYDADQSLSDEEKARARNNVGAASQMDLAGVSSTASSASSAANGAATTAEKAAADAAQASAAASDAGIIADLARIAANSAEIKAGDAKIDAQSAVDTAQSAVDTAQSAAGIGIRVEAALDEHVADKANPHAVTAAQVGAYTKDETDSKVSEVDVREQLSGYVTKTEVEPNEVYSGFADSAVQALYLAAAPDSSQKIGFETVSGSVYPYLYDGPFSAENNALLIRGDVNPSSSNIGFAAYADHALTANSAGSADAAGKVPWTGVTDKPDVATKSELYAAVTGLASEAYVNTHVATKQDRIDDLAAIRAGAEKGTTALQAAPVTSVSGKTGAVTLVASDIGALPASAQTDGSYVVEEKTAFGAGIDLPAVEGSVADVTGTAGITPVNDGSRLGFVFSDGNSGSQSRLFADGSPVMTMTACDERYAQVSGFVTASSQLLIVDGQPTAIEHGKFYCWKATSTAATSSAVTLEDNGKENEARLYLDYRTAASQISFPSDATVLYRDGSVKLNAFEVGNRYFVDLQWFSTSQREGEWESSSIVVVNAYKVAAAE